MASKKKKVSLLIKINDLLGESPLTKHYSNGNISYFVYSSHLKLLNDDLFINIYTGLCRENILTLQNERKKPSSRRRSK